MSRNWGIATGNQNHRGVDSSRPHTSPHTQAGSNIIQLADYRHPSLEDGRLNSRSQEGELFIQPFELGACCLFFLVVTAPAVLVTAAIVGYALFIAEPI
jgi:hypothetical protein